ncbi:MAG: haloacid dehalogenase type II [Rhodospirillaceae bacterium]|jgi:2-haloacid dehalogenase|nr:haloacid dehalogenase type II [Rhodospirillaceae bacterium]MBT5299703.1 haloacid dehalogenase type II [Rhodospirillaceae bacterium]MBT5514683.1 haloacid dehalogenase type II [Rhodospirillaceae bacterium]MBT6609201.1 haloacid dehalogenase type II [Rhodospirillaceae bacterium]MBT6885327.1 haloacid dehalogenase type II [Rhodospirillaceae bacterium]
MPKLVTFDVYMALLDIQGSLTPALADALNVPKDQAGPMVQLWRAKQMERAAASNSLGHGRTSFRDATRMGLDYVLGRNEITLAEDQRHQLVMAWDILNPWPEAIGIVREIKARGYMTAILSNGDQDMLDAVAAIFGDDMEHVLSSETAGKYKPHPAVYELPTQILGIEAKDVLHVAGAPGDVLGAAAFGMPCYWSNRFSDILVDPAYPPNFEGADLNGVLPLL